MNNTYNKPQDPNKTKKCTCEDKYGPKSFDYKANKTIKNNKSN